MSAPTVRKYPRTTREAFQGRTNPPLAQRESRFHGEFTGEQRKRFWKTLKSLILGD